MAYPDELLSRGERVVLHKHPHWKVLVLPTLFFVLIIGGGFALAAVLRHWDNTAARNISWMAIGGVGVILLILLVLVPVLRWRTEHFILSTAHVFFRTGIIRHRQHQIPLSNIQNIEIDVSFWGRILGYGTLVVESAADQPLEFLNVASITSVQSTLNQLIQDERWQQRYYDDGMGDGRGPRAPYRPGPTGTQVLPPPE